jgi:LysM repeat protein
MLGYSSPMTAVEGLPAPSAAEPTHSHLAASILPVLCPYLATLDGTWRSASAVHDHRCMAVAPPVPLALEKQRRLCLVDAHVRCATFGVAEATRATAGTAMPATRPVARMTPVILDHRRFDLRVPAMRADRVSGQALLVGVLGIALTAILLSRPSGDAGAAGGVGSASPAVSAAAPSDVAGSAASPAASPTDAPATDQPITTPGAPASPTASVAASPVASAEPSTSGATYKVKSGDTLTAIAVRFDTTVRVLVQLNGISDPSRLKVGQVIKLP